MPQSQAKAIYKRAKKTKAELVKLSQKIAMQKTPDVSATTTQPENVALQQMKALEEKKRAELADLNFLLRFPELCPPDLAFQYAPVCNLPEKTANRPRNRKKLEWTDSTDDMSRKRFIPDNTFEKTVVRLSKEKLIWDSHVLTSSVLGAYGLKTLSELLSVLKREYNVQSGIEALSEIIPVLMKYSKLIDSYDFIMTLKATVRQLDPPAPNIEDLLDHSKWKPVNRFEQFMMKISDNYTFTHYRQVGPTFTKLYGISDEHAFATHVLAEYGITWDLRRYPWGFIQDTLWTLYYHLKCESGVSRHVRAWLYYFMMRIFVYSGRPKGPFIHQIPEQIRWKGEYHDEKMEGILISKSDYDPEDAEKELAEVLKKHKKSNARAKRNHDQLKRSLIRHEPTVEEIPPAVQPIEVQFPTKKGPKAQPVSPRERFDKAQAIDARILNLKSKKNENNKDDIEKEIRILESDKINLFDEMAKIHQEKSGFIPGATDERYYK